MVERQKIQMQSFKVDLVETIENNSLENNSLLQERVKVLSKNFQELEKSRKATKIILIILEEAKVFNLNNRE